MNKDIVVCTIKVNDILIGILALKLTSTRDFTQFTVLSNR